MKRVLHSTFTKYLLAWIPLPGIAIFNGMLRELTYCHVAGEELANQISAILLGLLIMLYVVLLNTRFQLRNIREAVLIGLIWLVLTIASEVGLGLMLGATIHEQLESYNIFKGNFWPLVLLSVFLSPIVFRRKSQPRHLNTW